MIYIFYDYRTLLLNFVKLNRTVCTISRRLVARFSVSPSNEIVAQFTLSSSDLDRLDVAVKESAYSGIEVV